MELVHLPRSREAARDAVSHTGLSVAHVTRAAARRALVFNAANAPFLPLLRARRIPFATHVDGLEWKRAKWGAGRKRYYRRPRRCRCAGPTRSSPTPPASRTTTASEFGAPTELIAYGAPIC